MRCAPALLLLALSACGQVEPEPPASSATSETSRSSSSRSPSSISASSSSVDAGRDATVLTDAELTLCDYCWTHLLDGTTYCELQLDASDPDAGLVPCPPRGSR